MLRLQLELILIVIRILNRSSTFVLISPFQTIRRRWCYWLGWLKRLWGIDSESWRWNYSLFKIIIPLRVLLLPYLRLRSFSLISIGSLGSLSHITVLSRCTFSRCCWMLTLFLITVQMTSLGWVHLIHENHRSLFRWISKAHTLHRIKLGVVLYHIWVKHFDLR